MNKKTIKLLFRILYASSIGVAAVGIILLAVFAYTSNRLERVQIAWFCAGAFVLLTIPLTLHHIQQHLRLYTDPTLQICIVRVLWMVPIYAVESYVALRWKETAMVCATLRDFYEAYVIYNFFNYLLHFLGGVAVTINTGSSEATRISFKRTGAYSWTRLQSATDVEMESELQLNEVEELAKLLRQKPPVHHLAPLCCVKPWTPGKSFLRRCQYGVLQYVLVRVITTTASIALDAAGLYHNGEFDWEAGYPYCAFANNMSQIWAMYCLILFYQGTKEELAPVRPMAKLICIKAIVFFSFWQSVAIAGLTSFHIITTSLVTPDATEETMHSDNTYTPEELGEALNNFVICVEMFLFALAHRFAFPISEFEKPIDPHVSEGIELTNRDEPKIEKKSDKKSLLRAFIESALPDEMAGDTMQLGKTALKKVKKAVVAEEPKPQNQGYSPPPSPRSILGYKLETSNLEV